VVIFEAALVLHWEGQDIKYHITSSLRNRKYGYSTATACTESEMWLLNGKWSQIHSIYSHAFLSICIYSTGACSCLACLLTSPPACTDNFALHALLSKTRPHYSTWPCMHHLPYCYALALRHYTTLPYCILTCPTVTNLPYCHNLANIIKLPLYAHIHFTHHITITMVKLPTLFQ
jgi:hypothetical protein